MTCCHSSRKNLWNHCSGSPIVSSRTRTLEAGERATLRCARTTTDVIRISSVAWDVATPRRQSHLSLGLPPLPDARAVPLWMNCRKGMK